MTPFNLHLTGKNYALACLSLNKIELRSSDLHIKLEISSAILSRARARARARALSTDRSPRAGWLAGAEVCSLLAPEVAVRLLSGQDKKICYVSNFGCLYILIGRLD